MFSLTFGLAIINIVLCLGRFIVVLRQGRLIAVYWALIFYFSLSVALLAWQGPFERYKAWTGDLRIIDNDVIGQAVLFVLLFNSLFFIVEYLMARGLLQGPGNDVKAYIRINRRTVMPLVYAFGLLLVVAAPWYLTKMQGMKYRDYVEFSGSNWAIVFFWSASPVATLLAIARKRGLALLACVPYIVAAYWMNIRSFALISLIPVLFVIYLQAITTRRGGAFKFLAAGFFTLTALLLASYLITMEKTPGKVREFALPDFGMPFGMAVIFDAAQYSEELGFNSLAKYGMNILSPYMKLLNIKGQELTDTPVYLARLYDGVPLNSDAYHHYPVLWYSDAYISFGWKGQLLAVLWAALLVVWERIMVRNWMVFAILLPIYMWHAYMLVRGATAVAAVPFSYFLYVASLVALVASGGSFLYRSRRIKT